MIQAVATPFAPEAEQPLALAVLRSVGHRRVLWGSEAFIWPDVQPLIELFATMQIPDELQERYGFPAITEAARRDVFGLNQARLLGIDVAAKLAELAPALGPAERSKAAGAVV